MIMGRTPNVDYLSMLPKLLYRFNGISIKIPLGFSIEIAKLILKFMQKCEEPSLAKTVLKENKVCELTLPAFKTCYIATVIKTKWYWCKDRQIGQ